MKKRVEIKDRGKYIYFKNRKIRTPVTLDVSDAELKELKLRMRMSDIQSFNVSVIKTEETEIIDYDYNETEEIVIEELEEEEPKTTLEKYMKDGDVE